MSSPVLLAREGAIATLTLNRPDALNALDFAMIDALIAHTSAIAADDAIRVVVIAGAGKHFMAGGDIRVFAQSLAQSKAARTAALERLIERVHAAIETLARMPQPVIARVHGAVAGFGLSLANACDLVFASDDAYFASAYLQIAVTPDGGGTYWLPRIVGARKAAEIMMLGERFGATEAQALGLANRVVAAGELDAFVAAAAKRIAEGPTLAVRNLKRLLRESAQRTLAEQLQSEARSFAACAGHDDFATGIEAFLAKRAPDFHRKGSP
jgi:2-(1,2-epoxy-1,2-dihydrophenyl)acetyl-CoA isomerase